MYVLTCQRKQTVSSHIVNLDQAFILKNFDSKLALGDTDYISFILSLFSLANPVNFISVYVKTSFIFLLAQHSYPVNAKGILLTTDTTMNGSNLSGLTNNFSYIPFQWLTGWFTLIPGFSGLKLISQIVHDCLTHLRSVRVSLSSDKYTKIKAMPQACWHFILVPSCRLL